MAPVPIKYVVSFSSQDSRNPVENLLDPDVSKKWLCAPGEKSGRLEVELQMEKACTISHLDIGTHFVFSLQVLVGRSSWPSDREFVTLLPSSIFTSPADCRTGKNKTVVRMFKKEDFDVAAFKEKWDRIRVLCSQPFRKDVQFGLSMFKVVSDHENVAAVVSDAVNGEISDVLIFHSSPSSSVVSQNKAFNSSPGLTASLSKIPVSPYYRVKSSEKSISLISPNGQFSRAGQLLTAATGRQVQYKLPSTSLPAKTSETSPRQIQLEVKTTKKMKKKTIEEEMNNFVGSIDFTKLDLETVTFADIRHRFEKQIFRKLSQEERKYFKSVLLKVVEMFARGLDKTGTRRELTEGSCSKPVIKKVFNRLLVESPAMNGGRMASNQDRGCNETSGRRETSSTITTNFENISENGKNSVASDDFLSRNSSTSYEKRQDLYAGKQKIPSKRKLILNEEKDSPRYKILKRDFPPRLDGMASTTETTDDVWLSRSSPVGNSPQLHSRTKPSSTVSSHFVDLTSADFQDDYSPQLGGADVSFVGRDSDVECPLCTKMFPSNLIAAHASDCCL